MFDKIYCLTLRKRPGRTKQALDEFRRHGVIPDIFFGVDGSVVQSVPGMKPGEVGCVLSHAQIVDAAIAAGHKSVLITEDDVVFADDWRNKLRSTAIPDDWEMLYLGGNHEEDPVRVSDTIFRVKRTYTTHAYALRGRGLELASKLFPTDPSKITLPADVYYANLQQQLNCYVIVPHLAWQRAGYSDIQNKYADYAFLKDYTNSTSTKKQDEL